MATIPRNIGIKRDLTGVKGIDTSGSGSGAYIAQGLQDVSSAYDQVAKEEKDRLHRTEVAKANTLFATSSIQEEEAAKESPDYATSEKIFTTNMDKRLFEIADGISDSETKERFINDNLVRLEHGKSNVRAVAKSKFDDASLAELNSDITELHDSAVKTGDVSRIGAINAVVKQRLESAVENGLITAVQAGSSLKSFKENLKDSLDDRDIFNYADDQISKGASLEDGMKFAKTIKDPKKRLSFEKRFRDLKAVAVSEEKRIEFENTTKVYDLYSKGEAVDPELVKGMNGRARMTFNNIVLADENRKTAELEKEEKLKIKESFQHHANLAFNGSKWADIKDQLSDLPVEERNKIKAFTVANSNYEKALNANDEAAVKKAQKEYFEQVKTSMELDGLRYGDINDGAIIGKLNSDQIIFLKTRSAQLEKPLLDAKEDQAKIKKGNIEWSTRLALLNTAKSDPKKALHDFYQVADRFGETRRISFEKELSGYVDDNSSIDSVLTLSQRVNAITGDSSGKKDPVKAFELMEKWDTYQAGIQAESKRKRKPNKAETDLFFSEATKEIVKSRSYWFDGKQPAYKSPTFDLDVYKKRKDSEVPKSYKDPYWNDLSNAVSEEVGIPAGILSSIVTAGEKSNHGQTNSLGTYSPYQITKKLSGLIKNKYGFDPQSSSYNASKAAALIIKERLDAGASIEEAVASYHGGLKKSARGKVNKAYVKRVMADLKRKGIS